MITTLAGCRLRAEIRPFLPVLTGLELVGTVLLQLAPALQQGRALCAHLGRKGLAQQAAHAADNVLPRRNWSLGLDGLGCLHTRQDIQPEAGVYEIIALDPQV